MVTEENQAISAEHFGAHLGAGLERGFTILPTKCQKYEYSLPVAAYRIDFFGLRLDYVWTTIAPLESSRLITIAFSIEI